MPQLPRDPFVRYLAEAGVVPRAKLARYARVGSRPRLLERLVADCVVTEGELATHQRDYGRSLSLGDRATAGTAGTAGLGLEGRTLGSYRLERMIGRGGQGAVYDALHLELGRRAAVKVLRVAADDDIASERLRREALALQGLRHQNIVAFYDFGRADDLVWLAMELVEGESAGLRLRREGPLGPREGEAVLRQVLDGLDEAHRAGLVHRDLSINNVLLRRADGAALITDFGLAKGEQLGNAVTSVNAVVGTAAYIAPEVYDGEEATQVSDLWAVGVLACELTTGRCPFRAKTTAQMLRAVCTEPADLGAIGDPTVQRLAAACLDKDPRRRIASATAARDLLDAADEPPKPIGLRIAASLVAIGLVVAAVAALLPNATLPEALASRARVESPPAPRPAEPVEVPDPIGPAPEWYSEDVPADAPELTDVEDAAEPVEDEPVADEQPPVVLPPPPPPPQLKPRVHSRGELAAIATALDAYESAHGATDEVIAQRRALAEHEAGVRAWEEVGALISAAVWDLAAWDAFLVRPPAPAYAAEIRTLFSVVQPEDLTAGLATFQSLDHDLDPGAVDRERRVLTRLAEWVGPGHQPALELRRDSLDAAVARLAPKYEPPPAELVAGVPPELEVVDARTFRFAGSTLPQAIRDRDTGIELVLIRPGTFGFGAARRWRDSDNNHPQVRVTISEPFYLGRTEVTRRQWQRFLRATNHRVSTSRRARIVGADGTKRDVSARHLTWENPFPRSDIELDDAHPVTFLHPADVDAFCVFHGFELPTEAQWEFACRGGRASKYWWGDQLARGQGNFLDRPAEPRRPGWRDPFELVARVDRTATNPFGLQGMLGNVSELCRDGYVDDVHQQLARQRVPVKDPFVPPTRHRRVVRGGNFFLAADECGAAARYLVDPMGSMTVRYPWVGFRVMLSLDAYRELAQR